MASHSPKEGSGHVSVSPPSTGHGSPASQRSQAPQEFFARTPSLPPGREAAASPSVHSNTPSAVRASDSRSPVPPTPPPRLPPAAQPQAATPVPMPQPGAPAARQPPNRCVTYIPCIALLVCVLIFICGNIGAYYNEDGGSGTPAPGANTTRAPDTTPVVTTFTSTVTSTTPMITPVMTNITTNTTTATQTTVSPPTATNTTVPPVTPAPTDIANTTTSTPSAP
jgi:hypothetical protein